MLEDLIRKAEEEDNNIMVSKHIAHFVKTDGECTLCDYVFICFVSH
jgi:hypothetical protein